MPSQLCTLVTFLYALGFIHVHSCSPIGEVFRARLRQFPSLVNCCTIDWFSEWPDEALRSVANDFLQNITEIDSAETVRGLVRLHATIYCIVPLSHLPFLCLNLILLPYLPPLSFSFFPSFPSLFHLFVPLLLSSLLFLSYCCCHTCVMCFPFRSMCVLISINRWHRSHFSSSRSSHVTTT